MNSTVFKIKDTVDVYVSENNDNDTVLINFHVMTTRDRIEIKTNKSVSMFLAMLDGSNSIDKIMLKMGIKDQSIANDLINFLLNHRLIFDVSSEVNHSNSRFIRQTTFWDDFVLDRSGNESQVVLENKKVVLLGCGATGSKILEILVRAGVNKIIIVDYKNLLENNRGSHNYYSKQNVNTPKVAAFQSYLLRINKNLTINSFHDKLLPHTDISKWIPDDTNLIINTLDEPYIGHTSLKIGRYAQNKKIPFYVGGGFDAHLMSSGELVNPPHTPCIDCIQNTFSNALVDWKPIYSSVEKPTNKSEHSKSTERKNYVIGGAGGLSAMSSYSANLSALKLLNFLLDDSAFNYENARLEYLPNSGEITRFKFENQLECEICNE